MAKRTDTKAARSGGAKGLRPKFNVQGHALIAKLAQDILEREHRAEFQALQALIESDPFKRGDEDGVGQLAQWPDRIKNPRSDDPPGIRDFADLGRERRDDHFVNFPYDRAQPGSGLPAESIGTGNLLAAISDWRTKLKRLKDPTKRVTALAFVLHLVGDIHQPLHCAMLVDAKLFPHEDGDQGGNLIWWGESQSLHELWDGALARQPDDVARVYGELSGSLSRDALAQELARTRVRQWAAGTYDRAKTTYEAFFASTSYIGPGKRGSRSGQLYKPPSASYIKGVRDLARTCAKLAAFRLSDVLADCL